MDALKFAKQKRRMCLSFPMCEECPFKGISCNVGYTNKSIEHDKKIIDAVEKWAAEHPEKTRQSEFLKMFPNAPLDENGISKVFPCKIDESYGKDEQKANCCKGKPCDACRREFWLTPLEE